MIRDNTLYSQIKRNLDFFGNISLKMKGIFSTLDCTHNLNRDKSYESEQKESLTIGRNTLHPRT